MKTEGRIKEKKSKKLISFLPGADTYYDLAEERYDSGDLEGAIFYYHKAYKASGDIDALIFLGETYLDISEPEEALKYLFRALNRAPSNPELCDLIAQCLMEMDDDETAFFYIQPSMSIKRFRYIMEETDRVESTFGPPIRMLEKNDDMLVNIAIKLLSSGDVTYARELLLTVKADSEYYISACNLLSISFLEEEKTDEAILHAENSLKVKDNIDAKCNLLMAFYLQDDTNNVQRLIAEIEGRRLDLGDRRTVSLAYIRIGDAARAQPHLKVLLDAYGHNRDTIITYALCQYRLGNTVEAKELILSAARIYPEDAVAREIAFAMSRGEKLDLYPILPASITADWLKELEEKLIFAVQTGCDMMHDQSFVDKIDWLYQSGLYVRQGKAAQILCAFDDWREYYCERLLDGEMDLSAKKACLYALLLHSGPRTVGMVIDSMYTRLKVRYPEGMDGAFRSAYAHAFASFAFSDSGFEDRLLSATKRLLKKYNSAEFDKQVAPEDNILAAVIFYAAKHSRIGDFASCCQLFAADEGVTREYLERFGIKLRAEKRNKLAETDLFFAKACDADADSEVVTDGDKED